MFRSKIMGLALIMLGVSSLAVQAGEPISIGESYTIDSSVMSEKREILISLPESYDKNKDRKYPVLYLLDGASHFHQSTGIARWLSESASQIPDLIIVGVPNTNRWRDLSPTPAQDGSPQGAEKFMAFFEQELMPYIDKQYRTAPYQILSGHSMAGMFGLNVLATKPDLFDAFVLMSPWLLSQDPKTSVLTKSIKFIKSKTQLSKFVYVTLGDEPDLRPSFAELVKAMEQHAPKNFVWKSNVVEGASHMSVVGSSVNDGLQAVFADLQLGLNSATAKKGPSAIIEYYKTLAKSKYGFDIAVEPKLFQMGQRYFELGQSDEAIAIYKKIVQINPQSVRGFDGLFFMHRQMKDYKQALVYIDKTIALAKTLQSGSLDDLAKMKASVVKLMSEQK
jgi:predicted alpha/beta superfamily hydrolase